MKTALKIPVLLLALIDGGELCARAQSTAFTYQGRLNNNGAPANGTYELHFTLYDSAGGTTVIAGPLTNSPTVVSNGLFTVTLNFGNQFPGENRWLEIGLRTNGGVAFIPLAPRQQITSTPYAIRSANAASAVSVSGSVSAAQLTGTISSNNIGTGSITTAMLAAGAVGSNQLAAGAVTAEKMFAVTQAVSMLTIPNPAPGPGDYFGFSVAALGSDRVIIGASYDDRGATNSGAAFLFDVNGRLLTTFTNPTPALQLFGNSAAAMGTDRVLIGAPYASNVFNWSGLAYLFSSNGTLLTTFTNPTPAESDFFGYVMAAAGNDQVLFGTPYADESAPGSGAAYLFNTAGTLQVTFTNPGPTIDDLFGVSVAAVGTDRVLIGAPYAKSGGVTNAGVAYLFSNNGSLLTVFTNPTSQVYEAFGYSLAAIGTERVLIGAFGNNTGAPNAGAAYLFRTDGTLLLTITNPAPAIYEGFGHPVSVLGTDSLLIGELYTGIARLFDTNGTLLLTIDNPMAFSGNILAVGNDRVLVGGPYDDAGAPGAGAAYLFTLGPVAPQLIAAGAGPSAITAVNLADGAVVASKLDPSIGLWTAAGYDIFRPYGNVGIGTSQPEGLLDVAGGGADTSALFVRADPYSFGRGGIIHHQSSTYGWQELAQVTGSPTDGYLAFHYVNRTAPATKVSSNVFTLRGDGKVGIGTSEPHHRLRIGGPGGPYWTSGFWYGAAELDNASAIAWNANAAGNRFGIGQSSGGLYFFASASDPGNTANPANYIMTISDNAFVGIRNNTPSTYLQVINATCNGNTWINSSDRALKENFAPVNGREVLQKVVTLPIQSWNYKNDANSRHIGPVAQDFHAAFSLNGTNITSITTVDADGVALAAIQGLNQKVEEEMKRNRAKDDEIAELTKRVADLEKLLRRLVSTKE
jgi:hypothetical protein